MKETIIIVGSLNARVGNNLGEQNSIPFRYGESRIKNNERLIGLQKYIHNIANPFYNHKDT